LRSPLQGCTWRSRSTGTRRLHRAAARGCSGRTIERPWLAGWR
jgi:hypothetical protein